MNKEVYLAQLRQCLKSVPPEEAEAALEFYEEYFADAGWEREEEVIREMGSPAAVAAQLKADIAMRGLETQPKTAKNSLSALWLVLLAVLASPVTLPLSIGIFCGSIGLLIALFCIFLALFISAAAVFLVGIVLWGSCFVRPGLGVFGILQCLGGGMICIGVSVLLAMVGVFLSRLAFRGAAFLINKLIQKRKKGMEYDKGI